MPRTEDHLARVDETLADEAEARTTSPAAADEQAHETTSDPSEEHHGFGRLEAFRMLSVALAAVAVWLLGAPPQAKVIGVVALAFGGWPIFREAAENLYARRMTMELSMTIALLAAAAISEFFTALVITFFVLVAEVLEGLTWPPRGQRLRSCCRGVADW